MKLKIDKEADALYFRLRGLFDLPADSSLTLRMTSFAY